MKFNKSMIRNTLRRFLYNIIPELNMFNFPNSIGLVSGNQVTLSSELRFIKKDIEEIMDHLDKIDKEFLKTYDKKTLPISFKWCLGYNLDLENPKTFNEKLNWLKINIRKPEMTIMADKYRVRSYLSQKGYGQYLNELYGVYNNAEELISEWNILPSSFVLKVNHWSGGNIFIKNKSKFDFNDLTKLDLLLQQNYYYTYRNGEWHYKDIEPCIIAEKYLEDDKGNLLDYKVFCFNGKALFFQVDIDRYTNHTRCYFDLNWEKQSFTKHYPLYEGGIKRPAHLNEMINVAEELSKGYHHMSVDFYYLKDKIVFGEITFFTGSGTEKFVPMVWDIKLGNLINLN